MEILPSVYEKCFLRFRITTVWLEYLVDLVDLIDL